MNINLTRKRAVASGSTGGIGIAIATGLAKAGTGAVVRGHDLGTNDEA